MRELRSNQRPFLVAGLLDVTLTEEEAAVPSIVTAKRLEEIERRILEIEQMVWPCGK